MKLQFMVEFQTPIQVDGPSDGPYATFEHAALRAQVIAVLNCRGTRVVDREHNQTLAEFSETGSVIKPFGQSNA